MGALRAINDFRKTAAGHVAAAVVAAPLLVDAFTGVANAGDGQIVYHRFDVHSSENYIDAMGAAYSSGNIAIAVFGTDQDMLAEAYKKAQEYEQTADVEVTFMHIPIASPITRAVIYADGAQISEIEAGTGRKEDFGRDILAGFNHGRGFIATLPAPSTPTDGQY